jgi:hypothetical protein
MRFILTIFIIFVLAGCTTVEFVRKDFTPQKKGVLRYFPTSNPEREIKYQNEVKKQATKFCNGDYKITKEYQALEDSGSAVGLGTGVGFGTTDIVLGTSNRNSALYNFVEFECKK